MSWLSAILGGVSNAIDRRDEREAAERKGLTFDEQRRMANLDSNQDRETLLYQTLLAEEVRKNQRNQRIRGGKNYAQFASNIPGYVNKAPVSGVDNPLPVAPRIDL
jgi:hypothetical protein